MPPLALLSRHEVLLTEASQTSAAGRLGAGDGGRVDVDPN